MRCLNNLVGYLIDSPKCPITGDRIYGGQVTIMYFKSKEGNISKTFSASVRDLKPDDLAEAVYRVMQDSPFYVNDQDPSPKSPEAIKQLNCLADLKVHDLPNSHLRALWEHFRWNYIMHDREYRAERKKRYLQTRLKPLSQRQ